MAKGHSQAELARAEGVTFQQVQKYEKGINRISVGRLYGFLRFLKVDIRSFFDQLDAAGDSLTEATPTPTQQDFELAASIAKMRNGKLRTSVINLIKSMDEADSD